MQNCFVRVRVQKEDPVDLNEAESSDEKGGDDGKEDEDGKEKDPKKVSPQEVVSQEYLVARLLRLEEGAVPYSMNTSSGKKKNVRTLAVCQRGSETKHFKLSHISNSPIQAIEWVSWEELLVYAERRTLKKAGASEESLEKVTKGLSHEEAEECEKGIRTRLQQAREYSDIISIF